MHKFFQNENIDHSIEILKDKKDKKEVFIIEEGVEKKIGETTEEIEFIERNGQTVIKRTQILKSDFLGDRKGVTIVESSSFTPLSFTEWIDEQVRVSAEYKAGEVHIEAEDGYKKIKLRNGTCVDVFSVELLLRLIPLSSGFTLKLNAFNATLASEIDVGIEVVEKEFISTSKGMKYDAWKVNTYFGDTLQTYWIGLEGRELLKQSSFIGEGMMLEFRR